VIVITDNDGKYQSKIDGFDAYGYDELKILICKDDNLTTLEKIIVNKNELTALNKCLNKANQQKKKYWNLC
jgi:hypothetical protein